MSATTETCRIPRAHIIGGWSEYRPRETTCNDGLADAGESPGSPFVGLCSYYRRFVEGFAKIRAPLHEVTNKRKSFLWTPECQEAFDHLKVVLTSAPVLAMPDEESPYLLDVDASHTSTGAFFSERARR